jgi:hypothetical protein
MNISAPLHQTTYAILVPLHDHQTIPAYLAKGYLLLSDTMIESNPNSVQRKLIFTKFVSQKIEDPVGKIFDKLVKEG